MDVIVTKKKIKNLILRVRDGKVYVSAPLYVSQAQIKSFVERNMDYINKHMDMQQQRKERDDLSFNDDVTVMGKKYTILETHFEPKHTEKFIFLKKDEDFRMQIKKIFAEELYDYLKDLSLKYFHIMSLQVPVPKIIMKDVKSKWGSYNRVKHEIIYSFNVMFKDIQCYDYLVVHELSHILEFNHSKNFYAIVEKYCPDYKELRKQLKEL